MEDAGNGTALIADLRRSGVAVKGRRPQGDKVMRMSQETAALERGAMLVPNDAPWLAELRTELLAFPHGRHDDQVDALSQALAYMRTRRVSRVRWGGIRGTH